MRISCVDMEGGLVLSHRGGDSPGRRVVVSILVESGQRVEMAQAYHRS